MDQIQVRWSANRQFVAWDEAGHTVVMDATPEFKGESAGMRPLQVFLAALAGCSAMDIVSILEKKRQDVRDIEVRVEGEQRTEEFPRIYTQINIDYTVTGYRVSPDAMARAIELSIEKYCSVAGMLSADVKLTTSFSVIEAPAPRHSADS